MADVTPDPRRAHPAHAARRRHTQAAATPGRTPARAVRRGRMLPAKLDGASPRRLLRQPHVRAAMLRHQTRRAAHELAEPPAHAHWGPPDRSGECAGSRYRSLSPYRRAQPPGDGIADEDSGSFVSTSAVTARCLQQSAEQRIRCRRCDTRSPPHAALTSGPRAPEATARRARPPRRLRRRRCRGGR